MELILVLFFSKNEYAEVVRVRQLVDEVVEVYSQALQVCSLHWLQQLAIYEDFPCPQTCKSVNSSFTYDALVKI